MTSSSRWRFYEKGGGRHLRFHIENSDLVDARLVDELIKE